MDKTSKASMLPVRYLTITEDHAGQRIDNFLITHLKNVPKTRIYRILRKGEVRVNKKRAQPSYRLQADDVVRLPPMQIDDKPIPVAPNQRVVTLLQNRILYEDKGMFILNKPAGMPVHGGSGVSIGVIEALRVIYPKLPHLELVHRLDRDTSGCLVIAKKRSVLRELHQLLRDGQVHKVYLTLTKGQWKKSELKVNVALRKNHLSSGERVVKVDPEGKESLTVFEPMQSFGDAMLMEATLHTGRTHQIRVHACYRHHPIAGDDKYGDPEFNKQMKQYGLKRLFLHSHRLEFKLPSTGQHIKVIAPLDMDLQGCLNKIP